MGSYFSDLLILVEMTNERGLHVEETEKYQKFLVMRNSIYRCSLVGVLTLITKAASNFSYKVTDREDFFEKTRYPTLLYVGSA
jgi:hypothetical protein